MTAPRIMLDQKGNTIMDRKNRSKELVGSGEVVNSPTPSTGALLASVADHNSEHGVLLAVVAVRLHSSGLQGSTLHPAHVQ
jgi:hypothetical protein